MVLRRKYMEPKKDRTILHCDCNGFYASVECVQRPELRNVPMAVGGDAQSRHGIILAKNELAKQYDVKTAETIWQAKQKCPDLVIVPPRHHLYQQYSNMVNQIYGEYTEQVEKFGIDESYLDVTGSRRLFGDGETIANTLRERIKTETGLTISVGVSFNKVFAKLGSDYKKPDAVTVISRENYQRIVYPLPVSALLFVGKRTEQTLAKLYIRTIGDLAAADVGLLVKMLGKNGALLSKYARGEDEEPVRSVYDQEEVKSVGNSITFRRDLVGEEEIKAGIRAIAESVAARLRRKNLQCTTVQVIIKNPDFKSISRQKPLPAPSYLEREISDAAMEIIRENWNMRLPVRMLSVTGLHLVDAGQGRQLTLFDETEAQERIENLEKTLDSLRERYGKDIVKAGNLLSSDFIAKGKKD